MKHLSVRSHSGGCSVDRQYTSMKYLTLTWHGLAGVQQILQPGSEENDGCENHAALLEAWHQT